MLAHFILRERLHIFGMLGCLLCIVGSTTIVLHAPHERTITSVKEVWRLATEPGIFSCLKLIFLVLIISSGPYIVLELFMVNLANSEICSLTGFLIYTFLVLLVVSVLIFYYVPRVGQKHMIVYVGICSLMGSLTVLIISMQLIILKAGWL